MTFAEQIEKEGVTHTENDQEWIASSSLRDGTPSDENSSICNPQKKSSCHGAMWQEERFR